MTFVPAPNCVKAVLNWQTLGKNWFNTLWFWHPSGWTEADGILLADQLMSFGGSEICTYMTSTVFLEGCTVYDMNVEDSWVVEDTEPAAPGANPGALASLASAMTVTFRTHRRGRSYRGRVYLSGFAEPNVGGRTFDSALAIGVQDGFQTLPTYLTGIGCLHVVVSYYNNNAARTIAVHTPVTDYDAHTTIYRQGKRTH